VSAIGRIKKPCSSLGKGGQARGEGRRKYIYNAQAGKDDLESSSGRFGRLKAVLAATVTVFISMF